MSCGKRKGETELDWIYTLLPTFGKWIFNCRYIDAVVLHLILLTLTWPCIYAVYVTTKLRKPNGFDYTTPSLFTPTETFVCVAV